MLDWTINVLYLHARTATVGVFPSFNQAKTNEVGLTGLFKVPQPKKRGRTGGRRVEKQPTEL